MSCHHDRNSEPTSDRVTVAEVNDFLSDALNISRASQTTSFEDLLAYHERKADLLSRIAYELDTAQAHATAADAREQLIRLQTEAAWKAREGGDA